MTPSESNADTAAPVRSSINVPPDLVVGLLGSADENLRALERMLSADIHARGNALTLSGEPADVALAERVISELIAIVASGQPLTPEVVRHSVGMLTGTEGESPAEVLTLDILSRRGKTIRPKTLNQKRYVDAIDTNTIVFAIGPAGTGKTYLAMAKAVRALQTKQVSRIILTRPAVEAGERLGFLPGTLSEKIDPYLRPLYDALHDMMDPELIPKLMSAGVIEVAPLAYMRGRAQPLFTKVLTPNGFEAIGDLEVGDEVIGSDGRPTEVLGVYPQGFKEIYRVHTHDGSSTLASGDHLWSVHSHDENRRGLAQVLATKELIGNLFAGRHHRYELPLLSAPVQFAPQPVPSDPYALGSLLGDGSTARTSVPVEYLQNSPDVRLAVLQGLFDADGDGRTGRVHYATPSGQLADDVTFLAQSLGGVVYRSTCGRNQGCAHNLDVRLPDDVMPFRLASKVANYGANHVADRDASGGGRPMRFIDRIEPAGTEEAVCIQVAAEDSLYVTEDFLLTHNTLNDAFIILDEAQNTTGEQMKMFLTRLGFGSKMVVTGDVTQIDLPGGTNSGLRSAVQILDGVDDIHIAELTSSDVVRHRLVSDIVDAYAKFEDPGLMNRAQRRATGNRPRR